MCPPGLLPVASLLLLSYKAIDNINKTVLPERFSKRLVVLRENSDKLEMQHTPPIAPATGLLRLPFEIRLQIYHYCIPRKRVIEATNPGFNTYYYSSNRILDFGDVQDRADLGSTYLEDDDVYDTELGDDVVYDYGPENHVVYDPTQKFEDYILSSDFWNPNKNKNSIFLLSKQISEETLDILYGDNVFKLSLHGEGEYYLKKNFTDRNRQRMRFLVLLAEPRGVSYTPEMVVDDALWRSILPHLKGLRLLLEQPVEARDYYNAPTLEQHMDRWVNWIRPFLQCFGQHLSIRTNVQIDNDGRIETGAIMKECLPHGYREIRCRHFGDLVFKRGRFSWESGYWNEDMYPLSSRDADFDGYWDSD